jgi:hypothetical protein
MLSPNSANVSASLEAYSLKHGNNSVAVFRMVWKVTREEGIKKHSRKLKYIHDSFYHYTQVFHYSL